MSSPGLSCLQLRQQRPGCRSKSRGHPLRDGSVRECLTHNSTCNFVFRDRVASRFDQDYNPVQELPESKYFETTVIYIHDLNLRGRAVIESPIDKLLSVMEDYPDQSRPPAWNLFFLQLLEYRLRGWGLILQNLQCWGC